MDQPELVASLQHTYALFAPIRARFVGVGVERGGIERPDVVPVYVKRYGEYLRQVFPDVQYFAVESTFNDEQRALVNATLLAFKNAVDAPDQPLSQQIVGQFLDHTKPYFLLATVRAIETLLDGLIANQPHHAPTLDALFRVAGSEGLRDVIRLYGAHSLEQAINQTAPQIPDLLAFVNLHQRTTDHGMVQSEVWCPGTDLAKQLLRHMHAAASQLATKHDIRVSLVLEQEVSALPLDLVQHFSAFVQRRVHSVLLHHGIISG